MLLEFLPIFAVKVSQVIPIVEFPSKMFLFFQFTYKIQTLGYIRLYSKLPKHSYMALHKTPTYMLINFHDFVQSIPLLGLRAYSTACSVA